MGSCLGAGIVVGLSEGGIVVVGGNVVVKALGGKVDVAAYILIQFCSVVYVYIGKKMTEIGKKMTEMNYLPICLITALCLGLISSISSLLSVWL